MVRDALRSHYPLFITILLIFVVSNFQIYRTTSVSMIFVNSVTCIVCYWWKMQLSLKIYPNEIREYRVLAQLFSICSNTVFIISPNTPINTLEKERERGRQALEEVLWNGCLFPTPTHSTKFLDQGVRVKGRLGYGNS